MRFKEMLRERNISLQELSKQVAIPYATLHDGIEKPSSMKIENLKKLSEYFDLTMDETLDILNNNQKNRLLNTLREQKSSKLKGNIYHATQIKLAYNTNRMEGSKLSEEETRYIYETNTLLNTNKPQRVDDIVETVNHFYLFDVMLDKSEEILTEPLIKEFHKILKHGTTDERKDWFNIGEYKKLPNEVGGIDTTPPEKVGTEIRKLLAWYNSLDKINIEEIIEFHYQFEKIHPFQDGNGRVGRIIMFKECLRHNIIPFIIEDEYKAFYYRGLKEYDKEKGYLIDTCLSMQDKYEKMLKKFIK